jgi:chromosome partition protein MukF
MAPAELAAPTSVPEAVSRAYRSGLEINISREDMAFIAGIYTYIDIQQVYSLESSDLEKVYQIVTDITRSNPDSISQRVISATERLHKNQLLIRIDGGGLSGRPLYDMTQLGKSIVTFLNETEKLTRQSLTIITSRIVSFLSDIRKALESSGSETFWTEKVQIPLEVIVGELLEAIEKRQRGLDLEQNEVRSQISDLLEQDWLQALESCEQLLTTTSDTLQELYRTILSENTAIKQGLSEIFDQADDHRQLKVLDTIDSIFHRLDQLEQWGKERVASWSQYYRRVNDFLQSIVRFDPNRELSRKMTEQLQTYTTQPWFMRIIRPYRFKTLKEINLATEKQRVTRTLIDHGEAADNDDETSNRVLTELMADLKLRLDENKPIDLIELIEPYLEKYPVETVYPHIGTIIDLIIKESGQKPILTSKWEIVGDVQMQNLHIEK